MPRRTSLKWGAAQQKFVSVRKKATNRHVAARKNDAPRLVVAKMAGKALRFLFAHGCIGGVLGDQAEQRGVDRFAGTRRT